VHDDSGNVFYGTNSATRGNVIEMREFDWGAGAPGPLLRRTKNTYLHDSNSNYLTYNIVNKVLTQTICNGTVACAGTGDQAAQTLYEYDNYVAGDNPLQSATSAAQHDDTNFPSTFIYRGNLTRAKRWRNTDGALLTTTYSYDTLGNIRAIKDPLNHVATFDYTDSFATTACPPPVGKNGQAWVSTVTNPLGQQIKVTRFPCTALVQAHKDQNDINASRAGTTYTYDLLGRATQKNLPDGGQLGTTYNDVPPVSATSTTKITSALNLVTTTIADGLGRTTQTQLTSDPQGTLYTVKNYDALGRVSQVYNPTRFNPPTVNCGEPTWGYTTNLYDALNRKCVVVPADGTAVSGSTCPATQPANDLFSTYSGNTTTVIDQTGKSRESVRDGLGRLTQVLEDPGTSPHLNYETDYSYDILDNLLTVNQKGNDPNSADWRTRTFTYNSLSQLLTAANPESGTATYTYNSDGTLASKIAPAPNQTGTTTVTSTYSYDALHRATQKSFSDTTPTVKYGYDAVAPTGCTLPALTINNGIGKRTGMCDAAGAEAWSYDITANVGWKITDARTTNNVTKPATIVQNNLAGTPATLTYPSGRVITYGYDAAARPISAIDSTGPINYATAAAYAPTGALSSLTNGASLASTLYFNNRLQPCRISVKNTGTAPASCTDAANIGNVLDFAYNFSVGTADNGNVTAITNNRDTTRSQSFTYDSLNRISTAKTSSTSGTTCWDEAFGYDPWSNLLTIGRITGYTCSNEELLNSTATTKNQISGDTYDAAGNLITVPSIATYTFDAENQLKTATGVTYTYDGDGKRVQKSSGKLYWYGLGSDPLDETDLTGSTSNSGFKEYIFFGGLRIASRDSSNAVNYYFSDHLGTARIVANSSGTPVDDSDFYPFGGERVFSSSSGNHYKFTGKERDSESGLDNFGARYDSSSLGRFMSTDPSMKSVALRNPQSWNRYTYTLNNPLRYIDPDGELWVASGNSNDPYSWVDTCSKNQTCYESVAADVSGNLRVYGSNNAQDISNYASNSSGVVDLSKVSSQHDAQFTVKDGSNNDERFTTADASAGLFNTAREYHDQNGGDSKIVVTGASLVDGTGAPEHPVSHGAPNSAIDFRYIGSDGKPLQGPGAASKADPIRMSLLFGLFGVNGFNQTVSGRPADFGTGPHSTGPQSRKLIHDHQNHGHVGIVWKSRPPSS